MRRYDDLVDVRRGQVGTARLADDPVEGPAQFLWRGRLWKVAEIHAHWVETGAWWRSDGVHAVLGTDTAPDIVSGIVSGTVSGPEESTGAGPVAVLTTPATVTGDLCAERDVWRVEADRGRGTGRGVFDLVFDWSDGSWRLTRCLD